MDKVATKITLGVVVLVFIAQFFVRIPPVVGGPIVGFLFLLNLVSHWRSGSMSGLQALCGLFLVLGIGTWFWLKSQSWDADQWVFLLFLLPGLLLLFVAHYQERTKSRSASST